ncbi:MAG: UDP-galactopyranose mutase [Actinobacteria bacterium]|nr:MAG: UDP-galactopyranose mutase [Actinomycetota bacterium]
MAVTYAEHLKPIATVYDCMDELSLFSGAPPELRVREQQLLDAADLVFTGGASLYEAKRERHRSVHCFPSSVDADHFLQARAVVEDPADQAAIPRPRIGFVGVIDERVDLALIGDLADARPDWQIVLAGPVTKIAPESLPQRSNIHYLGPKRYEDLPSYLGGWDVAWMPFAHNNATRFISPTKTLEYLAAARPVVSTSIRDVVRPYGENGLVGIADDVEGTIDAVESALAQDPSEHRQRVDALLAETSWDRTWSSMQAQIDRVIVGEPVPRPRSERFDYVVVGAGFAGSTLAERLASQSGKRVLVVERRSHVGGNAYDHYDAAGVLVHRYGPHIFHTNSREVFEYLSDFTEWRRYEHRVRVDALLAETSWDRTWSSMQAQIDRVIVGEPVPRPRSERFDYVVVGAGFAGSTLAERLASQSGKRVLVVERRSHVGGNAYDHYDAAGVLVHRYGPHIFHTNSREVFEYLSDFTEWRRYEHRVRASVDGRLVPLPINLDTINELYGTSLDANGLEEFFASVAEPVDRVRTSEDVVVSKVGRELYEKFFRNYTRKQWDLDPSELDASVTARVPTRLNRDDRYFTDTYQAMPLQGYTRMFERMLDHPNIKVLLQTDYREIDGIFPYDGMIYTGPVDEFFDLRYGKLPYRSLEFRFETHDREWFQPAPVVNFPNEHSYTRCTEFKYLTGQEHAKTTVVYELPRAEGDPYYPVPRPENGELYKRYKALADATPDVHFVGRLATYKYYNMDQVVAQALAVFTRIQTGVRAEPTPAESASRNGGRVRAVRGRQGR